jgi:hypothetical protein
MTKQLKTSADAQPQIGEKPVSSGSKEERPKRDITRDKTRINFVRKGGDVKRFHTFPVIGEQTNGHHQYNVLSLLLILHPDPSMDLIKYITWHDTAEHIFGDVPATATIYDNEFYEKYNKLQEINLCEMAAPIEVLSKEDRYWFECLDKLEVYLFAKEQLNLGNKNMTGIIRNVIFWFSDRAEKQPYTTPDEILDVLANWDDL